MKTRLLMLLMAAAWILASCAPSGSFEATAIAATAMPVTALAGGTEPPFPTPEPPMPIATIPSGLSPTELKYRLLDEYADFFFCDPDYYPIARADELVLARQRFPELQANAEEFQAILRHNGLTGLTSSSDDQTLLIYRDHKKLAAILFEAAGDKYHFQLQTSDQKTQGLLIAGLIDGLGRITVEERIPTFATCPICLARGAWIDTPRGGAAVQDLRVGDLVWTMRADGERQAAPILRVTRVGVPVTHQMVDLKLSDGRELWASPGHPTTDGRTLGDLQVGDMLDGGVITLAERVRYGESATYDLLPAGETGFYWANDILLASTLAQP